MWVNENPTQIISYGLSHKKVKKKKNQLLSSLFWGVHHSLLVVLLTIHVFNFFHKRQCKRVGGILKDLNLCLCSQSLNYMLEELIDEDNDDM